MGEELQGKSPDEMTELFLEIYLLIYYKARKINIPLINNKARAKAKKHNYIPLDKKTVGKKKHRCWQRCMETRDKKIHRIHKS